MSPATALAFGGRAATLTATATSDTASLWARIEAVKLHDQEKAAIMDELMCRYNYLDQEYQRELSERMREHDDIIAWQKNKQQFEASFKSLQYTMDTNPFVVILIDGDGMIFQDDFIRDGEKGGRRAASQLRNAVLEAIQREIKDIPTNARIVCRAYANVRGLAEVLVRTGAIEEIGVFEDFVRGFTRGNPLFDFIDVGPGKDRADEKLIEFFKLYSGDMHCRQIFFGCSHDNGYARLLEKYSDDITYLRRVTLLEGVPFGKELLALPFKTNKFEGLFRASKIDLFPMGVNGINRADYNSPQGRNGDDYPAAKNYNILNGLPTRFPPPVRSTSEKFLLDSPIQRKVTPLLPRTPSSSSFASTEGAVAAKPMIMNYAAKAALPAPPVAEAPVYKPANREEVIARNRVGHRIDPPCRDYDKVEVDRIKKIKMCNVHFLRGECPYGLNCTHLHNYKPTKDELNTLRLVARMAPCQNGGSCQDTKCMYGHRCPTPRSERGVKGTKSCIFGESCKFPPELHDIDCNVVKTLVIR